MEANKPIFSNNDVSAYAVTLDFDNLDSIRLQIHNSDDQGKVIILALLNKVLRDPELMSSKYNLRKVAEDLVELAASGISEAFLLRAFGALDA